RLLEVALQLREDLVPGALPAEISQRRVEIRPYEIRGQSSDADDATAYAVQCASPGTQGASQMRPYPVDGEFLVRALGCLNGRSFVGVYPAAHPLAEILYRMIQFKVFYPCFYQVVRNCPRACHQVIRQEYPRLAIKVRVDIPPPDSVHGAIEVPAYLVTEF